MNDLMEQLLNKNDIYEASEEVKSEYNDVSEVVYHLPTRCTPNDSERYRAWNSQLSKLMDNIYKGFDKFNAHIKSIEPDQ